MGYVLGEEKWNRDHSHHRRNTQVSPEFRFSVSLLEGGELASKRETLNLNSGETSVFLRWWEWSRFHFSSPST